MKQLLLTLVLLVAAVVPARAWYVPDPLPTAPPFACTKAQKGVRISTDVLAIGMPVATLTGILIARDWTGLKEAAFTTLATVGASYILKVSIYKARPDGSNYMSFPSMHASVSFADATFLTRRYGWKIGVPAYVLSCYVAWGRCFAKKHDVWDVLGGAAIGAGAAMLFTHPWARKHDLSIAPATDGENIGFSAQFSF